MAAFYYDRMTAIFTEYMHRLRQLLPLLVLISLAVAALTYVVLDRRGVMYEVHFSYLISLRERPVSSQYQFDGYYALQAIELFAETLGEWIATPEVIVAAYRRADVPLPSFTTRQLRGVVRAEQTAPQLVHVIVQDKNRQRAEQLTRALQEVMKERIEAYHQQGTPALSVAAVASDYWVAESNFAVPLIAVASLVFTFLLGINLILLWEGLKRL